MMINPLGNHMHRLSVTGMFLRTEQKKGHFIFSIIDLEGHVLDSPFSECAF